MEKNCQNPSCSNTFTPDRFHPNKKFCSKKCAPSYKRVNLGQPVSEPASPSASQPALPTEYLGTHTKKVEKQGDEPVKYDIPRIGITDPAAAFIIDQLKQERTRWETSYKEQREAKKAAQQKVADLEKQIAKMESEAAIKLASRPSGLDGLLENPGFQSLLPFIGPLVQRIGEKVVDMATQQPAPIVAEQMAGAPQANEAFVQFQSWFLAQTPEVQKNIWEMLEAFKTVGDTRGENELLSTILQIQNFHLSQYVRRAS